MTNPKKPEVIEEAITIVSPYRENEILKYWRIPLPTTNEARLAVLTKEIEFLLNNDKDILDRYSPGAYESLRSTTEKRFQIPGAVLFTGAMPSLCLLYEQASGPDVYSPSIQTVISFAGFMALRHAREAFEKTIGGQTPQTLSLQKAPEHVIGMRRDFFDEYLIPQPTYLSLDNIATQE